MPASGFIVLVLVLLVTCEAEPATEFVEASDGGSASLPCNLSPPGATDKISVVLWYKGAEQNPIYKYDVRGNQPTRWSEPSLQNRYFLRILDDHRAVMSITPTKLSDEQMFHCKVDFVTSSTRITHVNLTIIVMEPQNKVQYSVTFDERDYVFSTDSAEAIGTDDEKTRNCDAQLTKTSSAMGFGGEGGDMNSASSISTSILDDAEEVKTLKRKINELEARNKLLEYEIEKVNLCLISTRSKNSKLEKKIQFVKDNQDVFIKLKEAYINMKYNEAAGRKMIEIREKGLQTWEGILCRGCIDAEQLRRQLQGVQETYKDSFIVKPFQLEQILNTVKYLKDLIDRREQMWSFNTERDIKMKTQIETLESENSTLRAILKTRDTSPPDDSTTDSYSYSDVTTFKKIIIKYEKKIREVEKNSNGATKIQASFNDKEKKLITHLMSKYLTRKRDKSLDKRSSASRGSKDIQHKSANSSLSQSEQMKPPRINQNEKSDSQ